MDSISQEQLRAIIFYEWRRGTNASTTAKNIQDAFSENVVSHRTVQRWFNRFKSGNTSLEDKERSGRPSTIDDDALLRCIKEKPEASTHELARELGCTQPSIVNHLHHLGFRKVLAQWIPHRLTDDNKNCRVTICQSLLLRHNRKEFLEDLVTGDESWVLYDNGTRLAYWLPVGEKPPQQPKFDPHSRKILLCCFWDAKGMLYYNFLPVGKTISATRYIENLQELAKAIKEKRPRRATVHLLHDNARPHVAKETHKTITELHWNTVPHPPYSPDIAPSDYHLFRHLKSYLRNKTFKNVDDLRRDISNFFESQPPQFWVKGINELPNRWSRVVETDGEYIID